MIKWSERGEMYLGVPSLVLIAEQDGVRLNGRIYPKLGDAEQKRSAFIAWAESMFGQEWTPPLAGDHWLVRIGSRGFSAIDPSPCGAFEIGS